MGKHSIWHVQIWQAWGRNECGEEETDRCGRQAIIKSKCNRCWQGSDPGSKRTRGSPPDVTKGRSLIARGHQEKWRHVRRKDEKLLFTTIIIFMTWSVPNATASSHCRLLRLWQVASILYGLSIWDLQTSYYLRIFLKHFKSCCSNKQSSPQIVYKWSTSQYCGVMIMGNDDGCRLLDATDTIEGCSINFRTGTRGWTKMSLQPADRQLRYDQATRSIMNSHETEILSANWLTAQHCHRGDCPPLPQGWLPTIATGVTAHHCHRNDYPTLPQGWLSNTATAVPAQHCHRGDCWQCYKLRHHSLHTDTMEIHIYHSLYTDTMEIHIYHSVNTHTMEIHICHSLHTDTIWRYTSPWMTLWRWW